MNPVIQAGNLLIAEPFMGDKHFERSVILVCEHSPQGSFGLILNQSIETLLDDVLIGDEGVYPDVPLFIGGPVSPNTLHFIHRRHDLIDRGSKIGKNLYWGGDFEQVKRHLNMGILKNEDIRFFVGYSGWTAGQLDKELQKNAWIVSHSPSDFIFDTPADQFWRSILRNMGGQYKVLSNYPTDPSLN